MAFGLKMETQEKIRRVLAGFPEIDEVLIYGSRAKGNFRTGSDIDLALVGENIDLTVLNRVDRQLDDLHLPWTFDLSIYHRIDNEDLLGHIRRVGKIFFKRQL